MALDPHIWSCLPREILISVITYANRDYTNDRERAELWQKWLSIVRCDPLLHSAVLSQQWGFVNMSWTDLVLDDSQAQELASDEVLSQKHDDLVDRLKNNGTTGSLVNELLLKDHGLCPAQVVRILNSNMILSSQDRGKYLLPSHQTISKTMNMILPIMTSLRTLRIKGPPSDTIFAALFQINEPKLQILRVGMGACYDKYPSNFHDRHFNIYDWSRLSKMTRLTSLSIRQLINEECTTLAELIPCLCNLRDISLAVRDPDRDSDIKATSSPLQTLLGPNPGNKYATDSDKPCHLLARLPTSLREIDLEDTSYFGISSLRVARPTQREQDNLSRCLLQRLSLEIEDTASVSNILDWLPNAALQYLAFSPVYSLNPETSDQNTLDPFEGTNRVISTHQRSLREIVFSNAWKIAEDFANSFNHTWSGKFSITDMVLSTDSPPDLACNENHDEFHKQDLKHLLFGCSQLTTRWGSGIERVRLEISRCAHEIDFLAGDLLDYSSFSRLRILMVSPRDDCFSDRLAFDMHQDIANKLLKHAPTTLQFFQICNFAYWVDRSPQEVPEDMNSKTRQSNRITVAKYFDPVAENTAGDDERTLRQFHQWCTQEDSDFIDEHSSLNIRRSKHNARIAPSHLDQYWLQSYNFLVARPISEYSIK